MPGESGLDLLQRARALHPNLPVIIMTAYSDLESAVGADVHLDDVVENPLALLRERRGHRRDQAERDREKSQRAAHDIRTWTAPRCSLSAW